MNIIIPDIDPIVVSLIELPGLVNLGCVNKYFYKLVSDQPITKQWLIIKSLHGIRSAYDFFIAACSRGFLSYGMFIIKENKIDIHAYHEYAFRCSCKNGHTEIARWLIKLSESGEYRKINIHINDEWSFRYSCQNGHSEIARWLIHLGESEEYGKININAYNYQAFCSSCVNGHSEIAHWLIHLGESERYNKIDQSIIDKHIKKLN